MKNSNWLLLGIIFILFFFVGFIVGTFSKTEHEGKYIKLSSDIQKAQVGDLLQVFSVDKDTIYVEFNGLYVHKDGQIYDYE